MKQLFIIINIYKSGIEFRHTTRNASKRNPECVLVTKSVLTLSSQVPSAYPGMVCGMCWIQREAYIHK